VVTAKESDKMLNGFKIAWTQFDRLEPMLLSLFASVETEKSSR
jgi:hypothetical protein